MLNIQSIVIIAVSQNLTTLQLPYSAKCWRGKTLANRSFQSFGEEKIGEFTIATISYYSESGIWLGKILANGVRFAKFAKVFFPPKFCAIRYVLNVQDTSYL